MDGTCMRGAGKLWFKCGFSGIIGGGDVNFIMMICYALFGSIGGCILFENKDWELGYVTWVRIAKLGWGVCWQEF